MSQYLKQALVTNSGPVNGPAVPWSGGIGTFEAIAGSWGGGSAKLQALGPNDSTYYDLTDVTLSANGAIGFEYGAATLRCVVTTATGVYASISKVSP